MNAEAKDVAMVRACGNCEYADPQQVMGPDGREVIGKKQLVCRRRPPSAISVQVGNQVSVIAQFPPVTDSMWCFDFWPKGQPNPANRPVGMDVVTV